MTYGHGPAMQASEAASFQDWTDGFQLGRSGQAIDFNTASADRMRGHFAGMKATAKIDLGLDDEHAREYARQAGQRPILMAVLTAAAKHHPTSYQPRNGFESYAEHSLTHDQQGA